MNWSKFPSLDLPAIWLSMTKLCGIELATIEPLTISIGLADRKRFVKLDIFGFIWLSWCLGSSSISKHEKFYKIIKKKLYQQQTKKKIKGIRLDLCITKTKMYKSYARAHLQTLYQIKFLISKNHIGDLYNHIDISLLVFI